jgi:hypothetical protein
LSAVAFVGENGVIYPKYNTKTGTWNWKSMRTGRLRMGTNSFIRFLKYPFTRHAWE